MIEGSVLCSTLFNLYFYDIPRTLLISLAFYMDNTVMYTTSHHPFFLYKNIHYHLNLIIEWCHLRRIKINERKTTPVSSSRFVQYLNRFTIENITIPWSDGAKYLEIIIDKRLTFNKHIRNIRNRAAGVAKSLVSPSTWP